MLLNISNHPSRLWGNEQRAAAAHYGQVRDLPFPAIGPGFSSEQINALADRYARQALEAGAAAAMVQGEFVFTYRLVNRLKAAGMTVLAAVTERHSVERTGENGVTEKVSEFAFAGFRAY